MRMMLICRHVFDVALCGIKLKNAARSLSLVGHPWYGSFLKVSLHQESVRRTQPCINKHNII